MEQALSRFVSEDYLCFVQPLQRKFFFIPVQTNSISISIYLFSNIPKIVSIILKRNVLFIQTHTTGAAKRAVFQ